MRAPHLYHLKGQQFWLSPDRSVFWEEEKAVIVSDLHFGKTGHFRKSGIAVPQAVYKEDIQRLVDQLQHFGARQLIVVGDLFHSHENKELELFKKWRHDLPSLDIVLIKGNHDILHDQWYAEAGITVKEDHWVVNGLCFTHDINALSDPSLAPGHYIFTGHIHPGITITGRGKQALRFPCFYFGASFAVLPAFSRFTGTALIEPKTNENVFAIVEDTIVQLQ